MIPKTYPSKVVGANTLCVVGEIFPGPSDVPWVTYIPVKEVTGSKINRYDTDGSIGVSVLSSLTGKVSWIDYIPVYRIFTAGTWRTDADGHIPVEVLEGALSSYLLQEGAGFLILQEDGNRIIV